MFLRQYISFATTKVAERLYRIVMPVFTTARPCCSTIVHGHITDSVDGMQRLNRAALTTVLPTEELWSFSKRVFTAAKPVEHL